MSQEQIFARLTLALAIGVLIGIERGWRERSTAEGGRTAGLRTFSLIGLSGGIWALMTATLGPAPLVAGFIAIAASIAFFRWREIEREGQFGATTVIAALLTYALGAYAVVGDTTIAAAVAVAVTVLLAAKNVLHEWVEGLTWEELRATLILLAMSFVALPLLPDRGYGPYEAINPHTLWLMTIAIAGVSYIGYLAVKLVGDRYGTLLAGVAGGLVSSTAATLDAARIARARPERWRIELVAALIASAVMFLRVLVIVFLFGQSLVAFLAGPLAAGAVVSLAVAVGLFKMSPPPPKDDTTRTPFANPFELKSVFGFAALLAVVLVLSKWLTAVFGGAGATVVAGVAGLADVDAITLSVTRLSEGGLPLLDAGRAVLIAVAANSLSKSAIAFTIGGVRFGSGYLGVTVAALAVAAAVAFGVASLA